MALAACVTEYRDVQQITATQLEKLLKAAVISEISKQGKLLKDGIAVSEGIWS